MKKSYLMYKWKAFLVEGQKKKKKKKKKKRKNNILHHWIIRHVH